MLRRRHNLLLLAAAISLTALPVRAGVVVEERPSDAVRKELRDALAQFTRDVRRRSSSAIGTADLAARGIVIVNNRPGPDLSATGIVIINNSPRPDDGHTRRLGPRSGNSLHALPDDDHTLRKLQKPALALRSLRTAVPSLSRLQTAVRRFEQGAGLNSRQVRSCKAKEGRCMQQCQSTLRRHQLSGECSCIGVRAFCLNSIQFREKTPGRSLNYRRLR